MPQLLGATSIKILKGTYTGFGYEDQAAIVRLLGRDPAIFNNEVVQTSALGAKSCSFTAYCDTAAERDVLVTKIYTQTTFDDGSEAVRNVNVVAARATLDPNSALLTKWHVEINLRER